MNFDLDNAIVVKAACELIAEITGSPISASQVRRLCANKKLRAVKINRDWLIDRESIASLNRDRPGPKRKF